LRLRDFQGQPGATRDKSAIPDESGAADRVLGHKTFRAMQPVPGTRFSEQLIGGSHTPENLKASMGGPEAWQSVAQQPFASFDWFQIL